MELYKNLELHCAVIGAEGGPWEWTVNTSRFLRRALVIIGIDSREGLCICATIHVLFCYIMGLVKRYVGFRALLLDFMDMETENLADGHIHNLTLTFNPSCYLSCLLQNLDILLLLLLRFLPGLLPMKPFSLPCHADPLKKAYSLRLLPSSRSLQPNSRNLFFQQLERFSWQVLLFPRPPRASLSGASRLLFAHGAVSGPPPFPFAANP